MYKTIMLRLFIFKGAGIFAICLLPFFLKAQLKQDSLPDGTEGVVFPTRRADTVFVDKKMDLMPNEFVGNYSTFRIGLGYIGDFTTYAYDNTFQQQLDSLKIDLKPTFKT